MAAGLTTLVACSNTRTPSDPYAGLSVRYEVGSPTFDAQVQPGVSGESRGVEVDVSAPLLSLVFRRTSGPLAARIEWLVRLMGPEGRQILAETSHRETVERSADEALTLFSRTEYSTFLEAGPGIYTIAVSLEDLSSGKTESRELVFEIPARNESLITTALRLETPEGRPIVPIHFPDTLSGVTAEFYLTGNVSRPVILHASMLRLEIPDRPAQAPYWQGPGSGLARLSAPPFAVLDTLESTDRVVRRGPLRRVALPMPIRGPATYRIDVLIEDLETEGAPPARTLSRSLIVRRPKYPRLDTFDELIPPLVYLADADEWEDLRTAESVEEKRRAFDEFWGRFMSDPGVAANAVRLYFSRVEEANLRYLDWREGWKTDRGMVYTILGEPLFVEQTIESEIWYYSYDEGAGERTFEFHRVQRTGAPDVIGEYVLDRSFEYERFWRGEIERWRTGLNL